jgi:RimJ/RimL family protein N-acetyltransferase
MGAIFDWADTTLKSEIRCIIDPGNVASDHVAQKLGFVRFATAEGAIGPVHVYQRPAGGSAA